MAAAPGTEKGTRSRKRLTLEFVEDVGRTVSGRERTAGRAVSSLVDAELGRRGHLCRGCDLRERERRRKAKTGLEANGAARCADLAGRPSVSSLRLALLYKDVFWRYRILRKNPAAPGANWRVSPDFAPDSALSPRSVISSVRLSHASSTRRQCTHAAAFIQPRSTRLPSSRRARSSLPAPRHASRLCLARSQDPGKLA